ncbi:putative metal-dependent HD superfamily phosphohydrolase [Flavobacterium piscis]|uniref:Metal-dependent HD superfamily phosphohydrolase n=2 Tax=Flavobacterium piscis TaxID=1114874 RepID=A0ABU1Y8D8_9FLAO|nr:putative metal-dependent HD superfamily phosphohydrolase [Flavobacterium piscis]
MDLKHKYSELLLNIGFNEKEIQQNWLDLEKAYSKKSRHYHNLIHIKDMIECYDLYFDQLNCPNEVLFAIFYHDYVYISSKKDNELKSAKYALAILPENANLNRQLVFDAIVATQLHQHNEIEDINWLIDFDLKVLARAWDDYKIYFEQIRKEYRIYPDFLYKPGRVKALKHFLENEFIFQTDEFRNLYEERARKNIEKEILLLS